MNEQYYKIEIITNNKSKNYIVSATQELQAKDRIIRNLKLKHTDVNKMKVNIIE